MLLPGPCVGSLCRSPSPTTTTAVGSGTWTDGSGGTELATDAGDTISCTYVVDNTGTQTLGNLCLVDHNVPNEDEECADCSLEDNAVVRPGEDVSCWTTYQVLLVASATIRARECSSVVI